MIYFDNAATTAVKPPEVARRWRAPSTASGRKLRRARGVARRGYAAFRARQQLARLFGAADPSCVSSPATPPRR
ncbi:MAG: hypothetical protein ACLR3C_06560 [Eggerthella lenta]